MNDNKWQEFCWDLPGTKHPISMKHLYLGLFLYAFTFSLTSGQEFAKAIVTDVNYMVRTGIFVSKKTFPYYFHYPEFIKDVQGDIRKHVKERFKVDSVEFLYPDSIYYYENWFFAKTQTVEKAKASKDKQAVYISVETIIQESSIQNGTWVFNFTTRVKAYKKGGRKVYSFKNHIPFEVWVEDSIYGYAQMKEEDFYTFYFDGLLYAFEGKQKTTEKRYVLQVPAKHYSDFFLQSEKFYLKRSKLGYTFGKDLNDLKYVSQFNNKPVEYNTFKTDWKDVAVNNTNKKEYFFRNSFKIEEYDVLMQLSRDYYMKQETEIYIKNKEKELIDKFILDNDYNLKGKFEGKDYSVTWNKEFGIAEVITGGEMITLIKMNNDQYTLFLKNNITEEQLGDIFNLLFVYDISALSRYDVNNK